MMQLFYLFFMIYWYVTIEFQRFVQKQNITLNGFIYRRLFYRKLKYTLYDILHVNTNTHIEYSTYITVNIYTVQYI